MNIYLNIVLLFEDSELRYIYTDCEKKQAIGSAESTVQMSGQFQTQPWRLAIYK